MRNANYTRHLSKPYLRYHLQTLALIVLTNMMLTSCFKSGKEGYILYDPVGEWTQDLPFDFDPNILPRIPDRLFHVSNYLKTGETLITHAIDSAISLAHSQGGGRVILPEGKWESGPIRLKSNIDLHIPEGSEIYFLMNPMEFLPAVFARHQGIECYKFSPLMHAENCTNIAITGGGLLHGQGKGWWKYNIRREAAWKRLEVMAARDIPVSERIFDDTLDNYLPPSFLQTVNCTNILIEGITLEYGPFWTLNPLYCENMLIRNVRITTTGPYGHTRNGDGINPSSCKNVIIENCTVSTGDDCFAIKSGRGIDGMRVAKPSENIVIRNCTALEGHGGVVIGSETSGGIHNIYMDSCQFHGTDRGIRVKTARGRGSSIDKIYIRNISMKDIQQDGIILNMLRYTPRLPAFPVDENTPSVSDIIIENVKGEGIQGHGIRLIGLPEARMKNISLKDIRLASKEGFFASDIDSVSLENLSIQSENPLSFVLDSCSFFRISNSLFSGKAEIDTLQPNSTHIRFHSTSFQIEPGNE